MSDKAVVLDTPEGISFFQLARLKGGLKIEIRTGMKMNRGPTAYSQCKSLYGLKGSRQSVLEQMEKKVADALAAKNADALANKQAQ